MGNNANGTDERQRRYLEDVWERLAPRLAAKGIDLPDPAGRIGVYNQMRRVR